MSATLTPKKKKLTLSRDTVRSLAEAQGIRPVAVTTMGPTEPYTYDMCQETEGCPRTSWC